MYLLYNSNLSISAHLIFAPAPKFFRNNASVCSLAWLGLLSSAGPGTGAGAALVGTGAALAETGAGASLAGSGAEAAFVG